MKILLLALPVSLMVGCSSSNILDLDTSKKTNLTADSMDANLNGDVIINPNGEYRHCRPDGSALSKCPEVAGQYVDFSTRTISINGKSVDGVGALGFKTKAGTITTENLCYKNHYNRKNGIGSEMVETIQFETKPDLWYKVVFAGNGLGQKTRTTSSYQRCNETTGECVNVLQHTNIDAHCGLKVISSEGETGKAVPFTIISVKPAL